MAAKTFAQLYADAIAQADESSGSGSSTAKQIIQAGINESYSEVAGLRDWKTLEDVAGITTYAGGDQYTPVTSSGSTPRIRRIESVIDRTNNRFLQEIRREVFEKTYPYVDPAVTTNQGQPRLWYPSGYTANRDIQISLFPVPNAVLTVVAWHYYEPLPLVSDADVPRIPDQYHYGLTYWALAKYYEFQRDFVSNYYRQLHQAYIADILNAEYGQSEEMPEIRPVSRNETFVLGKIGRIYN